MKLHWMGIIDTTRDLACGLQKADTQGRKGSTKMFMSLGCEHVQCDTFLIAQSYIYMVEMDNYFFLN